MKVFGRMVKSMGFLHKNVLVE